MTDHTVPAWCRVQQGTSALLLIAPHGGVRDAMRPAGGATKVNDLHSAELATELAAALDASLVANVLLDRNQLDLNRISQVSRRAVWFPALLERMIAAILERHERAEVLFLHGWNVAQAKCDIGVGYPLADEQAAAEHAALLTTSPAYVATRLAALRHACAARGILAPLGERYPARHANNVLQLFRRGRQAEPIAPHLAGWSEAGRIEAVQLELGLPLRWPGAPRQAFSAALHEAFAAPPSRPRRAPAPPTAAAIPAPAVALQTYDAAAGIGLLARVDPAADGSRVSGRVLLFLDGQRVALFTGDDPRASRLSAGGPHVSAEPDGLRLTFDGWLLCTDDGRRYVDLEQALATSHLLALQVDLRFVRRRDDYGAVRGAIAVDGDSRPIDSVGFCRLPGLPHGLPPWLRSLTLHAGLGAETAVYVRHTVPGGAQMHEIDGDRRTERGCRALSLTCDGDPLTPRHIVVDDDGGGLRAEPIARIAVIRPLAPGRRAHVTLGIARVTRGDASGFGFFEYGRVLA